MYALKNLLLFSVVLLLPLMANGQIVDDFSDGNLSENPSWTGDVSHFVVNAEGVLQLMAPAAGASVIAVQGDIPDSAVWEMQLRLEFAPSTSNLLRVYLMADQSDLVNANGYLLEIGETGNLDAIRFLRQDAGVRTLLASGVQGAVANEPVDIRLMVRRSANGFWTIDLASGSGPYNFQCSATDISYLPGSNRFFGFYCLYTATRTDKFFFDNLKILPDIPDVAPPVLESIQVNTGQELVAFFNEVLDSVSASQADHYAISGVGTPLTAVLRPDRRSVILQLPGMLSTGTHTLQCTDIADAAGNIAGLQSIDFSFVPVEAADEFDILINEIMADPSPPAGLPEVEWLELYNRSNKVINLKTLQLSDGGTPQPLPDMLLQAGAYVVLCANAGAPSLSAVAPNVQAMSGFPGLNNTGETLTLSTSNGLVVDRVAFQSGWHSTIAKRNGGWSLERINPNTPCLGGVNWQSCPVLPGGTPGAANASLDITPDIAAPRLLTAFPVDDLTLELRFSEGVDAAASDNTAVYQFDPAISVVDAQLSNSDRSVVFLQLGAPMVSGQLYRLSIAPDLTDCSGNSFVMTDTVLLGLPEIPAPQDIVINEVLFNPAVGGFRFIEFYNRSNRVFNWQQCFLANFFEGTDIDPVEIQRLFLPGEYIVLTENPADIVSRFEGARPDWVLETNLPSLSDEEDNVTLYWSDGNVSVTVDSFHYTADLHNPFFTSSDREGVSLERIRPEGLTNDPDNWTSAAGPAGGPAGTPTRPNSQRSPVVAPGPEVLTLLNERLSPDDDGYEDFLEMQYNLPDTDFAATITIYDAAGIPVKRIVRQALTGTAGLLRWNGDAEDGQRVRPGIYVVYAEFFEPSGQVFRVKKPVSVVRKF